MNHITIQREHDVRRIWPIISKGMDIIKNHMPEYHEWDTNNVLGELLHNDKACFLYVIQKNEDYSGFMIARLLLDEFTKMPVFFVWLLYLTDQGLMSEVSAFVHQEAKRRRCKFIRFESNRQGWDRVVKKFDGQPRYTVYQKEI